MNKRLEQFLSAENISQSQFADYIGMERASVSNVLSGRNKPSFKFIQNTMERYPTLNIEWLILGKGKMYYRDSQQTAMDTPPATEMPPKNDKTETGDQTIRRKESYGSGSDGNDEHCSSSNLFSDNQLDELTQSTLNVRHSAVPLHSQPGARRVSKLIIFYEDGSYEELP